MQASVEKIQLQHKVRILTAAALFDGHDVAINIMRRIMQDSGAEIIHLGHNRSVQEIVSAAIQEDVQAIAITSYQGGHLEFFKYMYDLLEHSDAGHIKIFGGGGGTILPTEIEELEQYGIAKIYSPDDGRRLGLQGMINDLLQASDFAMGTRNFDHIDLSKNVNSKDLSSLISSVENDQGQQAEFLKEIQKKSNAKQVPVLGITGTGGAGKSSLVDELIRRFIRDFPTMRIAILSVDPTKRKTGGALLGDRIRMNAINHSNVFMRSLATRSLNRSLSRHISPILSLCKLADFDLIILETSGIGQSSTEVVDFADTTIYVMTPEYGAPSQLEKIDMLDFADRVVLNKSDKKGALDALRDIKKQYRRNHGLWDTNEEELPVFATRASQFNDPGLQQLYSHLIVELQIRFKHLPKSEIKSLSSLSNQIEIIPPSRVRYLAEIAKQNREQKARQIAQVDLVRDWEAFHRASTTINSDQEPHLADQLGAIAEKRYEALDPSIREIIDHWPQKKSAYAAPIFHFQVRDKTLEIATHTNSLSGTSIPKIALPRYESLADIVQWSLTENVPGVFPFTAGVFPFKRKEEDPTRMFAGEGSPERTNRRFHYLAKDMEASRLSTAFDSVTLYGEDPAKRPDIFGKIGNSGVSVCTLDDAKKLYSGFDLCDPSTSVSMTINGPAATITAFFLHAVIDQQCEQYIRENNLQSNVEEALHKKYDSQSLARPVYQGDLPPGHTSLGLLLLGVTGEDVLDAKTYDQIRISAINKVRGTVQADILKEDQAQNTCIFSTEFSLKLMGDMQSFFVDHQIRNFYSVSISGYHIAEAGANPISQLAFTLANGFTYVEYYLSRGMHIDDFAPNLSFFFSNGLDPEYAVIGRVARRIWSHAIKEIYGGNERSQKLKYHIQTSGRSLHAQEISFNDIRTTLQALYAIYDHCNSLHTNAYDEAITTPTEESVRRAMAIQLIINKELGLTKNENPLQGSFIIEELTDLVEEAVLVEFERLTDRGGVLGAMETMYQRGKIQEESLHYETLKHSGEYPVIGVNTFLSKEGSPTRIPSEVIRSTMDEKDHQITHLEQVKKANDSHSEDALIALQQAAIQNENIFAELMQAVKYCSLGEITHALYQVGGQYRRNM